MKFAIMARILEYHGYGIQTYLTGLLEGLAALDHEHQITLLLDNHQIYPTHYEQTGFHIQRLKPDTRSLVGRLFWDHLSVGLTCNKLEIDALLAPAHIRPLYAPCPVVVTVHDMMYHLFPGDWKWSDQAYFRLMVKGLTTRAAAVHAVSNQTKADFLRLLNYPEDKVHVIYHGTPPGFCSLPEDETKFIRLKYSLSAPYILYSGSFHPRKNLLVAINVFEKIASDVSHDLVITGLPVWNENNILTRIRQSPYAHRIHVLGLVPREEMPALYNQAEIFLFPSLYEGFGFPILEAMACGCPVIALNASSIPEVANDAAILVSPEDMDNMHTAVLRVLLDESIRREYKIRGLQQASKFTWTKTAAQMLDLLTELGTKTTDRRAT